MSKNSGTKKKKGGSPPKESKPGRSMPKIPRTPPQQQQQQQQHQEQSQPQQPGATGASGVARASGGPDKEAAGLERILVGMETRILAKIGSTNRAVNDAVTLARITKDSLEALEDKVDENEAAIRRALEECEERMMNKFQSTVKDMVLDQLRAAGFDPDLTL